MTFAVEPLRPDHNVDAFSSGNPQLDRWLRDHARDAAGQGTRTYVLVDSDEHEVAGYFAIAPHLVARGELPRRVGRGAPRSIPAVLLAKLALRRDLHGCGLGAGLLIHALGTIIGGARVAGGKLVLVDAIDSDAVDFYKAHDFVALPGNDLRLVLKLSTAAKALGHKWP